MSHIINQKTSAKNMGRTSSAMFATASIAAADDADARVLVLVLPPLVCFIESDVEVDIDGRAKQCDDNQPLLSRLSPSQTFRRNG